MSKAKECNICHKVKLLIKFEKSRRQCKSCRREAHRAYRNTDAYRKYNKQRQRDFYNSPEGRAWHKAYNRTEKRRKYLHEYWLKRKDTEEYKLKHNHNAKTYRESEKGMKYTKEYNKIYRETDEHQGRCHELKLRRYYKLTTQEYDKILKQQGGVCAICGKPETVKQGKKTNRLAVDHCHETGEVRGLLCLRCNRAIGMFQENLNIMASAASYLINAA